MLIKEDLFAGRLESSQILELVLFRNPRGMKLRIRGTLGGSSHGLRIRAGRLAVICMLPMACVPLSVAPRTILFGWLLLPLVTLILLEFHQMLRGFSVFFLPYT